MGNQTKLFFTSTSPIYFIVQKALVVVPIFHYVGIYESIPKVGQEKLLDISGLAGQGGENP